MKCNGCNRDMKNHRPSGLGPICEKNMKRNGGGGKSEWEVEILEDLQTMAICRVFKSSESYKVTLPKRDGERPYCGCKTLGCVHIKFAVSAVGAKRVTESLEIIDRDRFGYIVENKQVSLFTSKMFTPSQEYIFRIMFQGRTIARSKPFRERRERDEAYQNFINSHQPL